MSNDELYVGLPRHATMNARHFIGVALMVFGPLIVLASPWLVLSFEPIRRHVFDEGWALLTTGQCIWFSELRETAAFGWFAGIASLGVAVLFSGLWLFRSARLPKKDFRHDSMAV